MHAIIGNVRWFSQFSMTGKTGDRGGHQKNEAAYAEQLAQIAVGGMGAVPAMLDRPQPSISRKLSLDFT